MVGDILQEFTINNFATIYKFPMMMGVWYNALRWLNEFPAPGGRMENGAGVFIPRSVPMK